jgi:cell pole-organizing protein PopZ
MLKDWLDEHLPAIVERLVQKEIQKLSRRAELN